MAVDDSENNHAQCQRGLPGVAEAIKAYDADQAGRHHHLQATQTEKLVSHVPELARRQFEPDQEEHQHNAEFREVLKIFGIGQKAENRTDDDAGGQIAQHPNPCRSAPPRARR